MEAQAAPTAGKTYTYILDGGILQSDRIGSGNNNGNNNNVNRYIGTGIFQFNNGTITNRGTAAVYFQNGSGFYAYPGSGIKDMQMDTAHPLTVQLAATGMHKFSTASGAFIYFTPSVSLVDKTGEAGTLLKDGAGTLVFTGGGSVATNTWSGNTTNSAGTILVDYSQIAGRPATGGTDNLTNGYSPASQLVLNGGNFVFTGRGNAVAGSATGVSLAANTYNQTITSTSGLVVGQPVSNPYLPTGTYIRRITSGTVIELNAMSTNTAAQSSQTLTFGAGNFANSQTITNVLLLTNATITVNPAGSSTLLTFVNITNGGAGTNTFTKAGTGTLSLTGNLKFTGTNTIAISSGTLDFATANNLYMTNAFTGSGVFSHSGSGTQVITSNNNSGFTGSVVVSGGTVQFGNTAWPWDARGLTAASSYTVSNNATLALNGVTPLNSSAPFTVIGATVTNINEGIIKFGALTMNAGTIWTRAGMSVYNNMMLTADVTVNGATASYINGSTASQSGMHLATDTGAGNLNSNRTITVTDPAGSLTVGAPLIDSYSNNGNNTNSLIKTGSGLLSLSGTNAYRGSTTISAGTLALSGVGSIANSPVITVAGGATFDVSGKNTAFTLGSSQTISNSSVGAVINGTNNCSAGTVSLVYDGVNPCFTQTNGGMALSAATTFKVNKTGAAALPHGNYKIIAKATAGNVGLVAGTLPAVTVSGGGITNTPGETASLKLTSSELYLVVNAAPVAKAITNGAPAGVTNVIRLIGGKPHLAPTDADGDPLLVSSVAILTGPAATVSTDGTNILYAPDLNASGPGAVQYVVSDGYGGYGTNTMYVTVTGQSFNIVSGPTLTNNQFQVTFAGIPNQTYQVDDSTNSASGPWAFYTNLTAGTNGLFQLVATNDPPAAMRFFRTRAPLP
jgi:autotransporter-associated beta strand protein